MLFPNEFDSQNIVQRNQLVRLPSSDMIKNNVKLRATTPGGAYIVATVTNKPVRVSELTAAAGNTRSSVFRKASKIGIETLANYIVDKNRRVNAYSGELFLMVCKDVSPCR